MSLIEKNARVLVTGGRGLIGQALQAKLAAFDVEVLAPGSNACDLTSTEQTNRLFEEFKPDLVFHLAARVYGIMGNMNNKGLSIYDNVMINTNVVEASRKAGVRKIVAMGSGCVYPYPPPSEHLTEDMMFQGPPHHSEDSYAHSKRLLYAMLDAYRHQYGTDYVFVISGNLFGPHDSFDIENGHVTPSLVHKFYCAARDGSKVTPWGSGSAQRDFTYSSDAADALVLMMEKGQGAMNMGSGHVHRISDIIEALAEVSGVGMENVEYDHSKPDGQEYRYYDVGKLRGLGFEPKISLKEGVRSTYQWFAENYENARK
jgi:GDP-L-fucose synthase